MMQQNPVNTDQSALAVEEETTSINSVYETKVDDEA